jgi:hypothetical protein
VKRTPLLFGIVFVALLFFIPRADAATLRITPGAGSFVLGGTFDVSVVLNSEGEAVNTIAVDLDFPADKLQLTNPSLGKSIIQIWANPPTFSNREGRIYFIGGIPSPGVNTSEGIVQSFTFRVVAPGEAQISFSDETRVLANDGLASDILRQTSPARFSLILPASQGPDIFSPTHPEQGRWYRDPNPIFSMSKTTTSQGFSVRIDHDPNGFPDAEVDIEESETSFSDLTSGVWYYHAREKGGGVWSGVSHFSTNIDRDPPALFDINVSPGTRTTNRSPIFRFFTTDGLSGFDHFEMKVVPLKSGPTDSTFFFEVSSPHQLSGIDPGRYEVIIRAVDVAGNFLDRSVTMNIVSSFFQFVGPEGLDLFFFFLPWDLFLPVFFLIILLVLVLLGYIWWHHRQHLRHAFREDLRALRTRRTTKKRAKK